MCLSLAIVMHYIQSTELVIQNLNYNIVNELGSNNAVTLSTQTSSG